MQTFFAAVVPRTYACLYPSSTRQHCSSLARKKKRSQQPGRWYQYRTLTWYRIMWKELCCRYLVFLVTPGSLINFKTIHLELFKIQTEQAKQTMNFQASCMQAATIQLNNVGVDFFNNGRFDESVELFRHALATSKKWLREGALLGDATPAGKRQVSPQPVSPQRAISLPPSSASASASAADVEPSRSNKRRRRSSVDDEQDARTPSPKRVSRSQQTEDDAANMDDFLYLHPMRFDERVQLPKRGVSGYQHTLSYSLTCMFNLAIASHARSIHTQDKPNAEARLSQATRLYELSYTLMMQEEGLFEIVDRMMTLAILNNVGVIHKQRRCREKSHQCFEHLLKFLIFFREEQQTRTCLTKDGEPSAHQYEGFYSNILQELNILRKVVTAACA